MSEGRIVQESTNETLKKLLPQLSYIQLRYLAARILCVSDKEAADAIGITPEAVYHWPNKAVVKRALHLLGEDGVLSAREIIRRNAPRAASVKVKGLESANERVQQAASTEILDRTMGKSPQKHEVGGPDGQPIGVTLVIERNESSDAGG